MSPSAEKFTDQDSLNSALRLDLRPGEWVLWSGRPHRFESLRGTRARIRDSNSKELREVDVAEIRGLPTLAIEDLDERLNLRRTSDYPTWQTAIRREEIIRQTMVGPGPSDRDANSPLQERQASYLRRTAPAARAWLANQQRQWPAEYLRRWWITDPSSDNSRYDPQLSVMH